MATASKRPGLLALLEGPQTLGKGPKFWTSFAVVLAAACAYPLFADGYDVGNNVYFFNSVSYTHLTLPTILLV